MALPRSQPSFQKHYREVNVEVAEEDEKEENRERERFSKGRDKKTEEWWKKIKVWREASKQRLQKKIPECLCMCTSSQKACNL